MSACRTTGSRRPHRWSRSRATALSSRPASGCARRRPVPRCPFASTWHRKGARSKSHMDWWRPSTTGSTTTARGRAATHRPAFFWSADRKPALGAARPEVSSAGDFAGSTIQSRRRSCWSGRGTRTTSRTQVSCFTNWSTTVKRPTTGTARPLRSCPRTGFRRLGWQSEERRRR